MLMEDIVHYTYSRGGTLCYGRTENKCFCRHRDLYSVLIHTVQQKALDTYGRTYCSAFVDIVNCTFSRSHFILMAEHTAVLL